MNGNTSPDKYEKIFAALLCTVPLVGALMPKAMTVVPIVIALVGLVAFRALTGRWPSLYKPAFAWMGALSVLMFASCLWSVDPAESLERALKTAPILLGGALLFSLANASNGDYFRRWFPLAVVAAGAVCVIELYSGAPFYHLVHERMPIDPYLGENLFFLNRASALMVLLIPLAACCVRFSDVPKNILYTLLGVILAAVLYKTNSQSAQLACIAALPFYLFFPANRRKALIALAVALALTIVAAPWIAQFMFQVVPSYAEGNDFLRRGYALNRLEIWDFIARRALESPLYGHGADATKVIKNFDSAMIYEPSRTIPHPHNFALQLWIEFGALGAVFGAAFLAFLLRGITGFEPGAARAVLAVMIGSISIAATGYGLWQGTWVGAFGALAAISVLAANKKPAG